jgi:NADH-quinone oxidoreductase subunit L
MSLQLTPQLLLTAPLAPLAGAVTVGLFGTKFFGNLIGQKTSHVITILGVLVALVVSVLTLISVVDGQSFNGELYNWMGVGNTRFTIGFMVDNLTAVMMCIVTSVSLMVHIYSVGYMRGDEGYNRFFSYISLFTFSMLMLIMSNNFLQLFFGWEAVGLVSYLLIGFWYTRPAAVFSSMKAFLVNRVGDFGFILGIGLLVAYSGSTDYSEIFSQKVALAQLNLPGSNWMLVTVSCVCLFIGAMGKSAQFPLHVWLPDSMEGPTPISALIHAATMVTAGIFMVTRMSPLFELSDTALSLILIVGSVTALFMGFLGLVQNDIKRVIAYSTLSQLGYMTAALGVSAYPVAIFHLMTHAFFKALLFLGAGSVIIGLHHDQDMRNMGGLRKYMPITWITFLIGSLSLIGTPLLSGFYSKDSIIEAVHSSTLFGSSFGYFAVLASVLVTSFYSSRMYFMVFHGEERFGKVGECKNHGLPLGHKPKESSWPITVPLIILAIPSAIIGFLKIKPILYGNIFKEITSISKSHTVMQYLYKEFDSPTAMATHSLSSSPFYLTILGVAAGYYCYIINPSLLNVIKSRLSVILKLLEKNYYLDSFNEVVLAKGARTLGRGLWNTFDRELIDNLVVNGSANLVNWFSKTTRLWHSGYIYNYACVMIVGVLGLLVWCMSSFPFAK